MKKKAAAKNFKRWLKEKKSGSYITNFAAARGFNPKKVTAEISEKPLFWLVEKLNLPTLCLQVAADAAGVWAHLSSRPALKGTAAAAKKRLDNATDANKEAVTAEEKVFAIHEAADIAVKAVCAAYWLTHNHPELTNKLDEIMHEFRENVHNSLIFQFEKVN